MSRSTTPGGTQVRPPLRPTRSSETRGATISPSDTKPRGSHPTASTQAEKKAKQASHGRFQEFNQFVDDRLRECSGSETKVWITLWRHTRNGQASVARSRLCAATNLSPSTVKRAIRRLRNQGLLDVISRGGPSQGIATYRVTSARSTTDRVRQ